MTSIAYFITPHGFGHASRAAAVMEALLRHDAGIRFELFTTSPKEIFISSIGPDFGYHGVLPDIGMVQLSPLREDIEATCDQLDHLLPYDASWVEGLADQLRRLDCRLVLCDIAPLGIKVARAAGIPSVLIENFTWDWIYRGYDPKHQRFEPHIEYLSDIFQQADHRIQSPPLCQPVQCSLTTAPISRRPRSDRSRVRQTLGIEPQAKMVLVGMGGVPDRFEFLSRLPENLDFHLVLPGAGGLKPSRGKVMALPTHSDFFYPDLMEAADALVGKAGYSTVAEAFHAGIPFGYIRRPASPESAVLEAFIKSQMPSMAIDPGHYDTGQWIEQLPELLSMPRASQRSENGADEVAAYLINLLV